MQIPPSELIVNPDGSIYHINLRQEDLAHDIITVGDPDRVNMVAERFDKIEIRKRKREFSTVTGYVGKKRLTVISTGIGADNIDIVLNECDALVNIDLSTRKIKEKHTPIHFYRIGTSGGLQSYLDVDSFVASTMGIGLEGLLHYYIYDDTVYEPLRQMVLDKISDQVPRMQPYISASDSPILAKLPPEIYKGITLTAGGFYGPQGRQLRLSPAEPKLVDLLSTITYNHYNVTNLEMETSAIYALSSLLGHQALSFNAIIANRPLGKFSSDPKAAVKHLIDSVLGIISAQ